MTEKQTERDFRAEYEDMTDLDEEKFHAWRSDLLDEIERLRAELKACHQGDIVAELRARNPYPVDIFPPLSDDDWDKVKDVLQYNRLSMDSISGNLMRMGYNVAVDKLQRMLEERKDGE